MMTEVKGYPIDFDVSRLAKCSDLIYFDGPLLSHYIDEYGDNYLMYWLEADDTYNRWMIVRTSITQIHRYTAKEITLREVILHPCDSFVWITNIDDELRCHHTQCVPIANLPEQYLPDEDSMYEFSIENCTELSTIYNVKNLYFILRQVAGEEVIKQNKRTPNDNYLTSSI